MPSFNDLEEIGKVVGAIVAILGISKIMPHLKKIGIFIKDVARAPFLLQKIISELEPNGGSSIRDSINRIENAQTILSQKLAYSIDQNGCGFFFTNALGVCVEVSPGYCRMVGKGDEESLGTKWIFNIHVKDRLRVISEWKESIDNQAVFSSEYSMVNSSGDEIVVKCHATPMKHANTIIGYFGIIEPITVPTHIIGV